MRRFLDPFCNGIEIPIAINVIRAPVAIAVSLLQGFFVGEFEIDWNDFPLGASVEGGGGREIQIEEKNACIAGDRVGSERSLPIPTDYLHPTNAKKRL